MSADLVKPEFEKHTDYLHLQHIGMSNRVHPVVRAGQEGRGQQEGQDRKTYSGFDNKAFSDLDSGDLNNRSGPCTKSGKDDRDLACGYGPLKCSKRFTKIQFYVVWMCLIGFVEGAAVNGIVNIILTTLEKRFNLSSSQAGLIVSSTDIGAIIFVLLVSYLGSKGHRPRWLGGGTLVMMFGSLIFIIPHIFGDTYDISSIEAGGNGTAICDPNSPDPCATQTSGETSGFLYIFMLAQFVHGIGFTPFFTLGTAYVDDNAKTESTAIYLGMIYAVTALGVAAGFIGGGQFLNLWIDFNRVDKTVYEGFTPMDSVWIGAWWVGFIITAILFFLFALPVLGYPINLPGTEHIREARITEKDRARLEAAKNDQRSLLQKIKDFPKAILVLLKNPSYICMVLGACAETLIIGGLSAFAPKILEEKFDISPASAGIIMGGVTIGGGAGGMILGGILIKCFKLEAKGMLRLCVLLSVLASAVGGGVFINCPEFQFAGLNQPYYPGGEINPTNNLESSCNANCGCREYTYEPICGADGVTYFTPCHAGCNDNYTVDGFLKTFAFCECINDRLNSTGVTLDPSAKSGECGQTCDLMYAFIILLLIGMLLTLTTVTPASIAILRCVPDEHRALGLGLQWVALRLLGTIPGPVLTGFVIDSSCALWQDLCGAKGSCYVYDRYEMGWRLFLWWIAVKLFSAVAFFIASVMYNNKNVSSEKEIKLEYNNGYQSSADGKTTNNGVERDTHNGTTNGNPDRKDTITHL
ncbi:solute carrier organic anion transporter family member 4A1-like [Mizuhopecten yessoensis]|uniref:solute carrier organic anion transporter family member 4A1-like n=1 Tax=Mizuhopecten yessoensis TaxID=6573 RepID=UPI000B459C9A|nr:solute carrier organic anion transporter family member 4A1-like [Mizuhopecten yessoensis]